MKSRFNENIFATEADAIVNNINCVGVMGKGIALEFKNRFPKMFKEYRQRCLKHEVKIGKLDVYPEYKPMIINFPTKVHWREKSQLGFIEEGLIYFAENYQNWHLKSVAFPQIGCANGGLNWQDVAQLMDKYLTPLKLDVIIYVDSKNNMKSKLEKQIQTLDLPDLQMAYEFMQNYAKFKEKIIWGAFKNLQNPNSPIQVTLLLESGDLQKKYFQIIVDLTGKKPSTEDKLAILWKLVKLQRHEKLGKDHGNAPSGIAGHSGDVFVDQEDGTTPKAETREKQSAKTQKSKHVRLEHFTER